MPKNMVIRSGNALVVYDDKGGATQWSINKLRYDGDYAEKAYKLLPSKSFLYLIQAFNIETNMPFPFTYWFEARSHEEELNENLYKCG